MTAFYNEIEPFCVDWLGSLIGAGHIAPGRVEPRSIRDLVPDDVRGAAQAHFFAGIGVWSAALRAAGWPDDVSVWTGSCPCQPFSQAGRGRGFDDDRHLWPAWFDLIRECRPPVIFGEQVASPAGLAWLDAVFADLEGAGYACGAADLCAAGVGAPHIRQRIYFMAHTRGAGLAIWRKQLTRSQRTTAERGAAARGVADDDDERRGELGCAEQWPADRDTSHRDHVDGRSAPRRLGDADMSRRGGTEDPRTDPRNARPSADANERGAAGDLESQRAGDARELADPDEERQRAVGDRSSGPQRGVEPQRGSWSDCDWIPCRDGKARPVEPGAQPLAHGAPARVGRLRGYGNAIVRPRRSM